VERAWTSAATPLSIVCPADDAVPPECRHVFVDNREPSFSERPAHFIQNESRIVGVVQHIAEQHRIEALILHGKMTAIVRQVVDASIGVAAYIQSNYISAEHALQMMRDEPVATADVENIRARRQHIHDFERHVVSATHLAAASHALEATFDRCAQTHQHPPTSASTMPHSQTYSMPKTTRKTASSVQLEQIYVAKNCRQLSYEEELNGDI